MSLSHYSAILYSYFNDIGSILCHLKFVDGAIKERPIMWAGAGGFELIVKMLLIRGAVDCIYQSGESPLFGALKACPSGLGERITRGYRSMTRNETGDTNAVVKLLLRYGADPNIRNRHGRVSLFWVLNYGSGASVEALLRAGCDPNVRYRYGRTPWMSATVRRQAGVVAALLKSPKTDRCSLDHYGRSAFTEARSAKYPHISKLLSGSPREIATISRSALCFDGYPDQAGCDICQAYIVGDRAYYRCLICNDHRFNVCEDCKALGATCLDRTHAMRRIDWGFLDAEKLEAFREMSNGGCTEHLLWNSKLVGVSLLLSRY